MKNSSHTITAILSLVLVLNVSAQHRSRGNENQQSNQNSQNQQPSQVQTQHQSYDTRWGHGHHYSWNNWGGGVTVQIGSPPNYGYNNYYGNNYYSSYNNGYNSNYSIKHAARNSLRNASQVIGNALQFSDWNDTYSPWLAKAIRHQQYAKQLYFWGDYAGALNHAERAGFLAWNTLNYFNNGYSYNENNGYGGNDMNQDPYQDPNNPYYRKGNTQSTSQGSSTEDDYSYQRKAETTTNNNNVKSNSIGNILKSDVDDKLPASKMSDQELLKTTVKDLDVD